MRALFLAALLLALAHGCAAARPAVDALDASAAAANATSTGAADAAPVGGIARFELGVAATFAAALVVLRYRRARAVAGPYL
jgi:hypothetical protein